MHVPFVDLSRAEREIHPTITGVIEDVVKNGNFILGPEVEAFEEEFARYCGVKRGVGVGSGTEALFLALRSVGVGPGDEVITAANTFIATFNAISLCGAVPVPVDAEPVYYCLDPERLEAAITRRTKAIVPVHLFGQSAEMDRIGQIAGEARLPVIEDSCQAHGAEYKGRKCGSMGDAGCFSFYPAKNLGAFGDAGIVVTDDGDISEKIALARNYGQRRKNEHLEVGYNMRLDEIQAAVLSVKLGQLDEMNASRQQAAGWYYEMLGDASGVTTPARRADGSTHIYHLFVALCPRRDDLRAFLDEKGVGTGIHYPTPPHLQPAYADLGYREGSFPVSEKLAAEMLSLPMFPGLTRDEVQFVCDGIAEHHAG